MNQFDKQQLEFLRPLLTHEVVLHFSFYANTFPIAYHYNLLLEQSGKCENDIETLLKPHDWNNLFPSKSNGAQYGIRKANEKWSFPEKINLFYTSRIDYKTPEFQVLDPFKIITSEIDLFDKHEEIKTVEFSNYHPCFVFLNNNLYTQNFLNTNQLKNLSIKAQHRIDSSEIDEDKLSNENYLFLAEVLDKARKDKIVHLCVYTDTISAARDIIEEYDWDASNVFYFDKDNITSLRLQNEYKNESKTLDIYFYSAPITFHFLRQTEKFIPVLLNPQMQRGGIKTLACLHYNKTSHAINVQSVAEALEKYHHHFFDTNYSKNGSEFMNNIRLAYNKYAKLIRHDSFFHTPESFNKCIAWHHQSTSQKTKRKKKKVQRYSPAKRNIHIHYGAGKLGIGLVLPLIKPRSSPHNQLIVIQKNRTDSEWSKKIDPDFGKVVLSNTAGTHKWTLALDLLKEQNIATEELNSEKNYFILFKEIDSTTRLLKQATSISYSLNDLDAEKNFLQHIANIKFDNSNVLLFPFENKPLGSKKTDPSGIRESILSGNSSLQDVKLKADRICLDRIYGLENSIEVVCEDHIEVVLNISDEATNCLFDPSRDRSSQIIFSEDKERFNFLSRRKEYLVNELHFILVVYGYDFLISKGITHWENQFVTIIQSALVSDPRYRIPVDTFIRLQIIRLLLSKEYPRSILKQHYDLEEENVELIYEHLLKYAKNVAERFSASQEDQISRVFNTNDANAIARKYKDIIEEIAEFISAYKEQIEMIQMLSGGTYLEYDFFVQDAKKRIQNILNSKINSFKSQVKLKHKEQQEKENELNIFIKKINNVINK